MTKKTLKNLKSVLITLFLACVALFCCSLWQSNTASAEEVASEEVSTASADPYVDGPASWVDPASYIDTTATLADASIMFTDMDPEIVFGITIHEDILTRMKDDSRMFFAIYTSTDASFYNNYFYFSSERDRDNNFLHIDRFNDVHTPKCLTYSVNDRASLYNKDRGFLGIHEIKSTSTNLYVFGVVYVVVNYGTWDVFKTPLFNVNVEKMLTGYIEDFKYHDNATEVQRLKNVYTKLGYTYKDTSTIKLNYLSQPTNENGFPLYDNRNYYETVLENIVINTSYLGQRENAFEQVLNVSGKSSLYSFNVVVEEYYFDASVGACLTRDHILRQATNYTYFYDLATCTATLTIDYSPFYAKDLTVRVSNNDAGNSLSVDYYTANVVESGEYTIITFNYEVLATEIYNLMGWLCGHYKEDGEFDADGIRAEDIIINDLSNGAVVIDKGATELTLKVLTSEQNKLSNIAIDVIVELVEDVEYTFFYTYVVLDNALNETLKTSTPVKKMYSEILRYSDASFKEEFSAELKSAISPSNLYGQNYMSVAGITKVRDLENLTYNFIVDYTYKTAVRLSNNINTVDIWLVLDDNKTFYTLGEFFLVDESLKDVFIPAGYRIKNLTSLNADLKVEWNDKDIFNTILILEFNTGEVKKAEIVAELTDLWEITIEYFEQYLTKNQKPTPFFTNEQKVFEIKVKDYSNIYALSETDLLTILGKKSFDLLGLTTFNDANITYNAGSQKYYCKVNYTDASLKKINYNGVADEVIVPITKYTDWTAQFGKSWSIMMLNNENDKWFNYANDVDINKLYGLFSVVVFEERVSDIEYIFRDYTYNGCVVEFQTEEVAGSSLYNFFHNTSGSISAKAGMFLCELFNEENKIYNSHFFYLDGTTDLPFASNSGATSYDDEDSASQNKWQDFTAGIAGLWQDIDAYVVLIASIVVAVVGLVLTIKLLSKIWAGEMQVVFKIILTLIFVALWVLAGIYGVPWVIDVINTLGGL